MTESLPKEGDFLCMQFSARRGDPIRLPLLDEKRNMISFLVSGDVVIVIETPKNYRVNGDDPDDDIPSFYFTKILSSKGIGWVWTEQLQSK